MFHTPQYAFLAFLGFAALLVPVRRWRRGAAAALTLSGLALMLGMPPSAGAAEVRRGQTVTVSAGQTVHNSLIAIGNDVCVDGTVEGDLIAFSRDLTVDGHVTGDVISFARSVSLAGTVDGNVRCFSDTLNLQGAIGKNATIFAAHLNLDPKGTVGGDMIAFAGDAVLDGKVTRDLLFFAGNTTLDGPVGGDVSLRGGRLSVGPEASLAGDLQVTSNVRPDIAAGAKLAHPLEFRYRPRRTAFWTAAFFFRQALAYGAAFLCGLLLLKFFPGLFVTAREAVRRVGLAMSVGALVLIAGIALTFFSLLLIFAGVAAGIATLMLYAPVLYGSQVFVGLWVGEKVKHASAAESLLGQLAVGLLILRILGVIPFLGFFVWAAVLIWGTGAISIALWKRMRPEVAPAAA
jgi:cytoskeletal protein CcmA (bactofilin family)